MFFTKAQHTARFLLGTSVFFASGNLVYAQDRTLASILGIFIDIIDAAIPLVMLAALLFFMYGVVTLIYGAGNDQSRNAAKQTMVWGLIALFCMVAIWGIVEVIQRTFFG